jgi:hypothetical protein
VAVRSVLGAALAAAALPAIAAAPAAASPAFGIGEQDASMFASPRFADLQVRHARVVVGWDALRNDWERADLDAWMAGAQRAGVRVLLGFGHSRAEDRERMLPTPRAFRREFEAFRARYPAVTDFIAWNEGNHSSQPTWRHPRRAAAYFDAIVDACRHCRVVAADVLDWPNMTSWLRAFRRAAKHRPRIWGMHNYIDANRFRASGTRRLLRAVKGDVWFTETGGLVARLQRGRDPRVIRHTLSHAARATAWVFRLARLSRRVKRVYLYHWTPATALGATWDSALLDRLGRPRPAFSVVHRWLARTRR